MIYQLLQSVRNVSFPNRPELITAASATGETARGGVLLGSGTHMGGGGVLLGSDTHMGGGVLLRSGTHMTQAANKGTFIH